MKRFLSALPVISTTLLPALGWAQSPAAPPAPAAPAAVPPPSAPISIPVENLPHELSPWAMVQNADWVVQSVMGGLVLASVLTWTIALAKLVEITAAGRRAEATLQALRSAESLDHAQRRLAETTGPAASMLRAAIAELRASGDGAPKDGVKERTAWVLDRIAARAARGLTKGTGILATIGSVGPFVGLFGTVWGIMNSFIGISRAQTTNLAVVAPGIAEALLATAIGLVAAIPAVVLYNAFTRSIAGQKAKLADSSTEVMRLLSRELDRAPRARSISLAAD
ncbi:tonB-system energizer ExbB [Rhodovarius crocodyli]|nr:tonB-system energizer ExbB [Rhodovarius crocodyli]